MMKRTSFLLLVLESVLSLLRISQLEFLWHQGMDLDYSEVEWFALETN